VNSGPIMGPAGVVLLVAAVAVPVYGGKLVGIGAAIRPGSSVQRYSLPDDSLTVCARLQA